MKATKLLLLVLSCMLVIGCKKNKSEDEPAQPAQQTDTISAQVVQSYFPYKNMDKIVFECYGNPDVTYTVVDAKTTYANKKLQLTTTMNGSDVKSGTYFVSLKAEVTNGTLLNINFQQITGGAFEINGSYTYDATKGKEIPETITLSNGAIIKKNVGLYYYKDTDFLEWTFYRRK